MCRSVYVLVFVIIQRVVYGVHVCVYVYVCECDWVCACAVGVGVRAW